MSNIKKMSDAERKRRRLLASWEIEKRKLLREMKELGEELAKTEAERDRAVDAAVALEQEIAKLKAGCSELRDVIIRQSGEIGALRLRLADYRGRVVGLLKELDGDADRDLFGTVRYAIEQEEGHSSQTGVNESVCPCETCIHGKPMGGGPVNRAYTCDINKIGKILKNTITGKYNCYFYEEAEE